MEKSDNNNRVRIDSVFISNYRSFPPRNNHENPNVEKLADINIFVGPNGCGKSNFFNAIRYSVGWHSFTSQGTYTLEKNPFNRSNEPIEIKIFLKQKCQSKEIRYCNDGRKETWGLKKELEKTKKLIYPIGLPRQFSEFNKIHRQEVDGNEPVKERSYSKIIDHWEDIYNDANTWIKPGYIKSSFPKPPIHPLIDRTADRFMWDIIDDQNNNVPVLEESDGEANFLLMIVKIRIREPGTVILIEKPEVSMHPGLQKKFMDYLKYLSTKDGGGYQFLVSTHSPYILNLAVEETAENIKIFRLFKNDKGETEIIPLKDKQKNWEVLRDLGHSPADVMQANGIIWVEGPSDVIYISTWLKKLAPELIRRKDYEIIWYGGSNFKYLGSEIHKNFWKKTNINNDLVDLFSINPQWAFIVDSDSIWEKNDDGTECKRMITINRNKMKFIEYCKENDYFYWEVDPMIEGCVKDFMKWTLSKVNLRKWDKAYNARDYIKEITNQNKWDNLEATISDITLKKINELIDTIKIWKNVKPD